MSFSLLRLVLPVLIIGMGLYRLYTYYTVPMTPVGKFWWGLVAVIAGALMLFFRYSKLKKEGML